MADQVRISVIEGDGIGVDVTAATLSVVAQAVARLGLPTPLYDPILAGAGYFAQTGQDIEEGGEVRAGQADAIFLGGISLPSERDTGRTENSIE